MQKVKAQTECFHQKLGKKALLEDQLGTLIQKMIVAKAPSCFIIPSARSFPDGSNGSQSDMERKYIFWASEYSDSGFFCCAKRRLHLLQPAM
jgi:hypothetical protein